MRTKAKGFLSGSLFYIPTKLSSVNVCTITSKALFVILCGSSFVAFVVTASLRINRKERKVFRKELKISTANYIIKEAVSKRGGLFHIM